MVKREIFAVAVIYVPVNVGPRSCKSALTKSLPSMLDVGQQTPILARVGGARFVLVEGLHRLEAAKAFGEKNHHRLPRGNAQALNGSPLGSAGKAAVLI